MRAGKELTYTRAYTDKYIFIKLTRLYIIKIPYIFIVYRLVLSKEWKRSIEIA